MHLGNPQCYLGISNSFKVTFACVVADVASYQIAVDKKLTVCENWHGNDGHLPVGQKDAVSGLAVLSLAQFSQVYNSSFKVL